MTRRARLHGDVEVHAALNARERERAIAGRTDVVATVVLEHEARHSGQWARWLGPAGFLPAYVVCCAWSWWFTGDPALRNHFECAAGLIDGGYAS